MKSKGLRTLFLITTLFSGIVGLASNSAWARGGGGGSHSSGSHSGSVHVSGYTRSNGTYVAPHTRSASDSGLGHSTAGKGYSNNSSESGSSSDSRIPTTSNTFQDALNSAMSAATLTQSAVSKDDWELVSSNWQNAILLLKQLPSFSPNYAKAQLKIQEYGKNLNYARQQLNLPPLTQPVEVAAQETVNNESQQNGESLTENSVPEASIDAPVSSPPPNTSTQKESSGSSGYSGSSGDSRIPTTSNTFQDALNSAMSAAILTQSAVSKDDWELVSSNWQNAILLLEQLPSSSPNYAKAQLKIQEYGKNLNYARQQLNLPPLTQPVEVATPARAPVE